MQKTHETNANAAEKNGNAERQYDDTANADLTTRAPSTCMTHTESEPATPEDDNSQVIKPETEKPSVFSALASAGIASVPWKVKEEAPHWVNQAVKRLWPSLKVALQSEVKECADKEIRHNLPDWIKGHVTIDRFELGSTPPHVDEIEVEEIPEGMKIRLEFDFASGVDIEISVGVLCFGVNQLKVWGAVAAELAPMIGELPVVGAIKVYCPDPPDLDYSFRGLARVADAPLIRTAIRHTLDQVIAHYIVAPNYMLKPLVSHDAPDDMFGRVPQGVLRVRPIRAKKLVGSDWSIFSKSTSDAYLQMKVGGDTWKSSVVKGTCDPEWPADEFHDFLVYDTEQLVFAKVYDQDWCNDDDFLGRSEPLQVRDAVALSPNKKPQALYQKARFLRRGKTIKEGPKEGHLEIEYDWLSLAKAHHRALESNQEREGFLFALALQKLVMPARLAKTVQVFMKTSKHKTYSKRVRTPIGNIEVAVEAVDKAVRDIVRKGGHHGINSVTLSSMTGLKENVVSEILRRSSNDKDQPGHLSDSRVVAEVRFRHSIFIPVSHHDLREGSVSVDILNSDQTAIAHADLKLTDMGIKWPDAGIIKFECRHHENEPSHGDATFSLYTKASVVELKKKR